MEYRQLSLYEQFTGGIASVTKSVNSLDQDFTKWSGAGSGIQVNVQDVTKQPYKFHPMIFACCNFILRNVSRLSWYLYDVNEPNKKIFDDPILDILQRPNPLLTKMSFIQAIILSILLPSGSLGKNVRGGQCFILCFDSNGESMDLLGGKIPTLMLPMNDTYITADVNKGSSLFSSINGWKFKIPSEPDSEKLFGRTELIRIVQFNPYNWLEGTCNFAPAMTAMMMDMKSDLYNDSLFTNLGIPTGVLSTEQPMSPEQRREELLHWKQNMSAGSGGAQNVALLSKNLKYQHIGLSSVDMQYEQLKNRVQEAEIAAFGENKIAVGKYEQINFATIREGRKMLWHDVNLPMIALICEALNYGWINFIDKNKRIGLDTSDIEYLQPDNKSKAETAGIFVTQCMMPPVMALQKAGISITDDDIKNAPWMQQNPLTVKAENTPKFTAPEAPVEPAKQIKNTLIVKEIHDIIKINNDEKDQFWYDYVARTLDPNEKSYIKVLRTYFQSQRNALQDNIDAWLGKQERGIKMVTITIDDLLTTDFKQVQNEKILKESKPIHKKQLLLTEQQLKNELGQLISWNVSDDEIQKSINRRSKFLKGLNTTTFKDVEKEALQLFTEAHTENWTPGQLAKELKSQFNSLYETRANQAMTIARTEIGSVTEDARYIAFVMEDIQSHQWLSALDEKVREDHQLENGNVVKVGDRFPVTGLLYPLDSTTNNPGEVINCRCVNIAVLNN
jgi:SPP1 gp7 family putative phage head morphogenesis protein